MKEKIGIVGGGQLGRMLALAAKELGFQVIVLDPTPNSPAGQVADRQIVEDFKNPDAIRKLGAEVDFLTFEIELANAEVLNELKEKGVVANPSPKTLMMIKDKFSQKEFLRAHSIPVADFKKVETEEEIKDAAREFGYPMLLKARFDSYDGRGNALVKSESEITAGMEKLKGRALYVEKFVPFTKELAVVAARGAGETYDTFPVVETIHENNICHIVIAPAPVEDGIKKKAENLALEVMKHLEGWGVFAIEMFLTDKREVLVNEIAPRVHNSGHFTIEACETSQFKQHILAVTGRALGSPKMKVPHAVMVNILGDRSGPADPRGIEEAQAINGVGVHVYGKIETRPERKMGHITVTAGDPEEAMRIALRARKHITI